MVWEEAPQVRDSIRAFVDRVAAQGQFDEGLDFKRTSSVWRGIRNGLGA